MNTGEIHIYQNPKGSIKTDVRLVEVTVWLTHALRNENFWLTQKDIAALFTVEVPAISKHLANIYETDELQKPSTVSILETVQQEDTRNVKRKKEFYTLDTIISVGYRVKYL